MRTISITKDIKQEKYTLDKEHLNTNTNTTKFF